MGEKWHGCQYQCDNDYCPYSDCKRPSGMVKLPPATCQILLRLGKETDDERVAARKERKKQWDKERILRKRAERKRA